MARPKPVLLTTTKDFDLVHAQMEKAQPKTTTVKVDKEALRRLLRDHSTFHEHFKMES